MEEADSRQEEFQSLIENMTSGITATRESIKKISSQ